MDDECLSLTWNNHAATYRQTLNLLRQENTLTDVTLACDGQKFAAHKLVLVTCSDYFRTILGDVPCHHPIVYLRGISAKEMQALIDFMYTGQTDIPQKNVPLLLSTAEALQIKGLGVFSADEDCSQEKTFNNCSRKERRSAVPRKRKLENPTSCNGTEENALYPDPKSALSSSIESLVQDNMFAHRYALSSPKKSKTDERLFTKSLEYATHGLSSSSFDNSPIVDVPATAKRDAGENNSLRHVTSNEYFPLRETNVDKSPSTSAASSVYSSVAHPSALSLHIGSCKRSGAPGQEQISDPRPEMKAASPRALNYTLAGLGSGKDDYGMGSLPNILEESNTGLADTPENLMKTEVKEEALDFTNTALSESVAGENLPLTASSIEEEARIYLDAFTRSANLSKTISLEDSQDVGSGDGRPFVCPICRKCFAKVAILKRHHLAHFRPYVCHICTRSFTRREVLAEHLLEHNGADLRLPCPVCNMTIKRKRNLQAHIKVKHPDYYKQKIASRESIC
ncbi:hypothetical protein SK128_018820 [Halocaridina rubra]|uniref:Uncharacterized protein n=1 Tax=Halocaridina rubra TaxID=373956 RepID=A0AAN8X5M0_HALRR